MEKTHRKRVLFVATISVLCFVAIGYRLARVQIIDHKKYVRLAQGQQKKTVTLDRHRGDIVDRKGQILATSTFYDSIYYNPKEWKGADRPPMLARRLARAVGTTEAIIASKLKKDYVTAIWRKVEPDIVEQVQMIEQDLEVPEGVIYYVKESKRLYPQGDLAGPVIGYTQIDDTGDNIGKAGIEHVYDNVIKGESRQQRIAVNVNRQGLAPMDENAIRATFGNTLVLTLDNQIQHYTQMALRKRVGEVQAQAGVAIVMDVDTGSILALANAPDFDPNNFSKALPQQMRNRLLTDPIEIGSVMKILTTAILLDNNLLKTTEMIDCEGGRAFVDGRRVTDSHHLGIVPFTLAFAESSNVAFTKLGLRLQPDLYYKSLKKFGLGDKTGIDLPGENSGKLMPTNMWSRLSRTSLPMGYETSMTGIQVITAISSIANGGMRMKPRLVEKIVSIDGNMVKDNPPVQIGRVASAETCKTVIGLMENVVTEGTGSLAKVPGYSVAGKTGTTKKSVQKESRRYISSFAGVIPASHPKLAIYIYIDEPRPEIEFYGGKVAAPVFAEIADNAVRILGIPPDRPEEVKPGNDSPLRLALARTSVMGPEVENLDGEEDPDAKTAAQLSRELALSAVSDQEELPLDEVIPSPTPASSKKSSAKASPTPEPTPIRIRPVQSIDDVRIGEMPVLLGLTMSEVMERMTKASIPMKMTGSGVAIAQSPDPGTIVTEGQEARIKFALPSQKVRDHELNPADAADAGAQPAR